MQALALGRLEKLINHALGFDPASLQALGQLAGRTLAVDCTFPLLQMGAEFSADGNIMLSSTLFTSADVTLKGTAFSLAKLASDSGDMVTFVDSGVEVSGSQDLLRDLRRILGNLDIDWEAALAALLGDVPAHLIAKTLRTTHQWRQDAGARAFSGGAEYLREEARLVIGRAEMEPWAKAVDKLARDTDRIAARVRKLRKRAGDTP